MENSRVTVDFSDDFLETYEDYTLSFMTNKMTLPLVYEKGEYRPMYFQADASGTKLTIGMELVNVYGKDVQYTATTTIKQKQWTKLTVRTDEKGLNGVAIDVVLNDETKETVVVNIGIPDFMEQLKGAPSVSSSFFNWDGKETMTEPTILDPMDANTFTSIPNISVLAGGKVDKAILSVTKDGESVLNVDFANLEEEKKAELESLYAFGLPETIKGQMRFDFNPTGLLNSLMPKKDVNAEYVISLSVTDALPESNTTTKLVKVVLKEVQDPSFSGLDLIEGTYQEFTEQKSLRIVHTLDLASCSFVLTNSSEETINRGEVDLVTGKTTVEGINWRKTEDAYYLDFTPTWLNTLSSGKFTLSVTVEDIVGIKVVKNIPVYVAAIKWLTTENDVYARHIILRAKALDQDISSIKFIYGDKVITEGLQDEGDGVVSYVLSDLPVDKKYTVIVEHNGIQLSDTWKAEEELQLPNNEFKDWRITMKEYKPTFKSDKVPFYEIGDIQQIWSTNNSSTVLDKLTITVANIGYRTFSAVTPSELKDFVILRSVGSGDFNIESTNEGVAGQLWLFDGVNEGCYISSRPQKLKCTYAFSSYQEEAFKVDVSILDNDGNEIANGSYTSNINKDAWGEFEVPIHYFVTNKKASRIKIRFYSSAEQKPKVKKESVTVPMDTNSNETRNYDILAGNTLSIQKVELVYE